MKGTDISTHRGQYTLQRIVFVFLLQIEILANDGSTITVLAASWKEKSRSEFALRKRIKGRFVRSV